LVDYIIVIAYLICILLYGVYVSKKVTSIQDFALSNRKYGAFTVFATLFASFIGGGFSFGNASKVYVSGLGYSLALVGFSIKEILVGKYIAPHMEKHRGVISTGGIIEKAFGREAKLFSGLMSVVLCGGMLGAQVGAMGYIFEALTSIDRSVGIFIGCAIVVFYSTTGGMKAVVATDVVQFLILFIGIPLTLVFSIEKAGGVEAIIHAVPQSHFSPFNNTSILGFIGLFFTFMLGEAMIPPYTQRLLIAKDTKSLKKATILSGVVSIPFMIITGLIGIVALALFPDIDANTALPAVVKTLPPIINGFVVAGLISVVMSSADSILNAASVAVVEDVIGVLKNTQPRMALVFARITNVVTAIIAVVVALMIPNVLDILILFYTIWAPCMLVPLIAAILGYKKSSKVFFMCAGVGIASALTIKLAVKPPFDFSYLIVSIVLSLIVFLLSGKRVRPC
jgi:solute:Na+ symporter, SSS family